MSAFSQDPYRDEFTSSLLATLDLGRSISVLQLRKLMLEMPKVTELISDRVKMWPHLFLAMWLFH